MESICARVEKLKLNYGLVKAVKDVSFELFTGEILAVIGPNGSGKTSAIECLEGLRKPSGGRVEILGIDPYKERRQVYQQVGIQLQEAEYPDKIRVKELCRLYSSFYEQPADWNSLLQQLCLDRKADRTVKKLSGGEKQRLSILLALLPHPKILILDELTTGLDPEVRRGMWDSLKQIQKAGTTILLVSHYLDEVAYLAHRLIYMENGCSTFAGTQEEFRMFAKGRAAEGKWREDLTLEEVYLLLFPKANTIHLEGIK